MLARPTLRIGLISDTHLPYRLYALPSLIYNIFQDVDLILHAGDVDNIDYLSPLAKLAPLYAVRGNFHVLDLSWAGKNLPKVVQLHIAARSIILTHGHRSGLVGLLTKIPEVLLADVWKALNPQLTLNQRIARRLHASYPEADIVVFGHTHVAYYERIGKTHFVNPGSTVFDGYRTRSVGILEVWADRVSIRLIPLDHIPSRQRQIQQWANGACD